MHRQSEQDMEAVPMLCCTYTSIALMAGWKTAMLDHSNSRCMHEARCHLVHRVLLMVVVLLQSLQSLLKGKQLTP